ncbi:MAG: hypothetical protein Q8P22_05460 [Chloroflexota bacterium]|nr:hypothetical protein [Chloroflexota bacterium]
MPRTERLSLTPIAWLAAAILAVAVVLGLAGAGVSHADTPVLAPGVQSLAIGGKSVTSPTVAVSIATGTPTISGRILPGRSTATFAVDGAIEWSVAIDAATGEFSTVVPQTVGPGTHTLSIDGVNVATFQVVTGAPTGAPVGAPASGGGGGAADDSGFGLQPWLFVLAGLALGGGLFLIVRRKPSQQ